MNKECPECGSYCSLHPWINSSGQYWWCEGCAWTQMIPCIDQLTFIDELQKTAWFGYDPVEQWK